MSDNIYSIWDQGTGKFELSATTESGTELPPRKEIRVWCFWDSLRKHITNPSRSGIALKEGVCSSNAILERCSIFLTGSEEIFQNSPFPVRRSANTADCGLR
jgi:hypothetical protein